MSQDSKKIINVLWSIFIALLFSIQLLIFNLTPYSLKKKKSVKGEIVLVTGGGNGFGRLLAIEFAKLGSKIVIWDVDVKGCKETCRIVKEIGGEIKSFILDVSDRNKVYETAKLVQNQVGDVSILINNAGIAHSKPFFKTSDVLMEKVMQVNAIAHFWTLKAFLPNMEEKNHGHVVCISSTAGLLGIPRASAYTSSKYAVIGLMESVSFDLIESGKTGVKTTVVHPYFSRTSLWEGQYDGIAPLVKPENVVKEIVKGVLTNKESVCVPSFAFMILWLKLFMPLKVQYDTFVPLSGKALTNSIKIKKVFQEQE